MIAPAQFRANPGPQERFLKSRVREVLYGGAAGGGKTWALLADPLHQLAVEHKRWVAGEIASSTAWSIHFRRVMPRLTQTIERAKRMYFAVDPGCKYDDRDHIFTWSCGMKSQFAHMERSDTYLNYLGNEYTHVAYDELTEFEESQYMELQQTRLRSTDPVLSKMLAVRAGSNPIGVGLLWVRKRFVDHDPLGNKIIRDMVEGEPQDRMFIPARLEDNPYLDKAYRRSLAGMKKESREALLEGNWYVTPGAFFGDEWDTRVHVCEPFAIPPSWPRFRSGDYGYSAPSSVCWWAVDNDNNIVCYRNLNVTKHTAEMLAHRIREIEESAGEWDLARGCSRLNGPLDPSCWGKTGHSGPSIAETMQMLGVGWHKADHDKKNGNDQIRRRLIIRGGADGKTPGIRFFKTCISPIRTLPALPSDPHNGEEYDTTADDHDADAVRYACMARPLSAEGPADREWDEDVDEVAQMRNRRRGGQMAYGGW